MHRVWHMVVAWGIAPSRYSYGLAHVGAGAKIRDIYVVILALLALVFPRASVRFPWLPLLGATPGSGSCLFSRVKERPAGFQR